MLNFNTPYGDHYKVDSNLNIIRMDMPGLKPSGNWTFEGLQHVKRNEFIFASHLTPEFLKNFDPCFKNGNPQWTVCDMDHGTLRTWGNTKYHGVKRLWFD